MPRGRKGPLNGRTNHCSRATWRSVRNAGNLPNYDTLVNCPSFLTLFHSREEVPSLSSRRLYMYMGALGNLIYTVSNTILKALSKIIAVQMTPNQDKLSCPRNILIGVRRGTVENVEKLSYSLNNPLGSIVKEKTTLQPVDIECRPLGWLVVRKDVFPQHRPQPSIQSRLLRRSQFRERNRDGRYGLSRSATTAEPWHRHSYLVEMAMANGCTVKLFHPVIGV